MRNVILHILTLFIQRQNHLKMSKHEKKDQFLKDYGIEDEKPWGKQIFNLMF